MPFFFSVVLATAGQAVEVAPTGRLPVIRHAGALLVADNGNYLGRGETHGPLLIPVPVYRNMYGFAVQVDPELEPSRELRILQEKRFSREPMTSSGRISLDSSAKRIRYSGGTADLSYSLEEFPFLAEPLPIASWSLVHREPSCDLFLGLYKHLLLAVRVFPGDSDSWAVSVITLLSWRLDAERIDEAGYGLYGENDRVVLFLPGMDKDRAWELYLPETIDAPLRTHLFPLPLQLEGHCGPKYISCVAAFSRRGPVGCS